MIYDMSFITIVDVLQRYIDYVHPTSTGTIKSFFEAMDDPTHIQCILDIPLAQVSMPELLR